MEIEFRYRKQKSKVFGEIYRPMAEVALIGEREVRETFYIDSGADVTLIPRSVGELLGLEFEEKEIIDMYGVGKSVISVVIKKIRMRFGEKEIPVRIAWALTEEIPLLLGRVDVFDPFHIIFKQNDGKVVFKIVGEVIE